jgi:hypothetical protein
MTGEPLSPPRAASEVPETPAPSFWRRQFAGEPTRPQTAFDVAFGVVLPLLLLPAMGFLGAMDLQPFRELLRPSVVTPFVVMEIVLLAAWLVARRRIGAANAAFSGALSAGAALAVLCGADLLPLSVMTVPIGIGLLGLIPFGTAFAFLRSQHAAWTAACAGAGRTSCLALAAAGFVVTAAAPFAAAWWIDGEVAAATPDVADANPTVAAAATARLSRIAWYPGFTAEPLLTRYENEPAADVKERIAGAYRAVTGRDPEDVIAERD